MPDYDVLIIGGGITGTALLYVLSRYTSVSSIALLEKGEALAAVNSHHNNNSQTLHQGDIETNYSVERAAEVKKAADLILRYSKKHQLPPSIIKKMPKMVLAVGEQEILALEERHKLIRHLFPSLQIVDGEKIASIEPAIVKGRNPSEKIAALYSEEGFAVDFGELAQSFVEQSEKKKVNIFVQRKVHRIERKEDLFVIHTPDGKINTSAVIVAAGAHSLLYAHQLGYGKEYCILPVSGGFYSGKTQLHCKVYTMQQGKIPFMAVHADPNIANPEEVRFGPTGRVVPFLERRRWSTWKDFANSGLLSLQGIRTLWSLLSQPDLRSYIFINYAFCLPFLGKRLFLKRVHKIIPAMRAKDISYNPEVGGIRPQILNLQKKTLEMTEGKIVGENIIFNITPSPGASVCLQNAVEDARTIASFLGTKFNEQKWKRDFT